MSGSEDKKTTISHCLSLSLSLCLLNSWTRFKFFVVSPLEFLQSTASQRVEEKRARWRETERMTHPPLCHLQHIHLRLHGTHRKSDRSDVYFWIQAVCLHFLGYCTHFSLSLFHYFPPFRLKSLMSFQWIGLPPHQQPSLCCFGPEYIGARELTQLKLHPGAHFFKSVCLHQNKPHIPPLKVDYDSSPFMKIYT